MKLILKQEISGKYIPWMIRSFLAGDYSTLDENLANIKKLFTEKSAECISPFIDFGMYIDETQHDPLKFTDFTIIIELFDAYNNGIRDTQ